ncbi:MAG: DnaD domain protein [Clostridia bacterium]|nr:DnaD domain protein [Clostridia bacterium]
MKYAVNPFASEGFFSLPSVVEKNIKIASHEQLKVIIWAAKNGMGEIDPKAVSEALRISESAAADALDYWTDNGALLKKGAPEVVEAPKKETKKAVRAATVLPSRQEIARRGNECPQIAFLLREAQMKFGRALKDSESGLIVWLYDDQGIDVPLMLMLFEHAKAMNNFRIGFIERTAMDWIDAGISDVTSAEEYLTTQKAKQGAWSVVERAFGIPHRKPSDKETDFAHKWVNEWEISFELLKSAYNICIDNKAKLSMPYINKILESWVSSGVKTPEDIKKNEDKPSAAQKTSAKYNIDLAKKRMFTSEDE